MINVALNTYLIFAYLGCWLFSLISQVAGTPGSTIRKWALWLLFVIWLIHTGSIGLRWWESYQLGFGHAPLSNLYESLIFCAWAIALALILARVRFKTDFVIVLGLPLVFVAMAATSLLDPDIEPLIPALQSNWLVAHVITCFLGYAGFAVSFVAALMLLAASWTDSLGKAMPDKKLLDEIVYRSILVGYPMLTVGIITGAAWADYAWGTYWSWDPKETWSLITWMVYSAFLHARLARGWSGHRTAILSVVGFAAVLFTFFGVSYLLPGLHSYF
jgi:cytochrome c-type biogenesis protein CcsB